MAFRFFLLLAIVVAVTAYAPSAGKVGLNQPNSMLNHPASNKATLLRQPERESRTAISAAAGGALISPITRASLNAVSKLMSTCGIGVLASKKGLLDKNTLQVLSKLVFGLLQPCMLFANVADTIAKSGGGAQVWLLPCAAASQIALGYIIGRIINLFVYPGKCEPGSLKDEQKKTSLTCSTFGNSGPLPFVFVDALFRGHPDPLILGRANAYISLYLLGWSSNFWIFAPAVLGAAGKETDTPAEKRAALVKRLASPPVVGSIMGLIAGSVGVIRNNLVSKTGLFNPAFEAVRTIGTGYLPAVLLILAGSLIPAKSAETVAKVDEGPVINRQFITQVSAIMAARFFLLPTIGFAVVNYLRTKVPSLASVLSDPVLIVVLLLETCMPSAQNSTVILNMQGKSLAAAKMARVLMAIYVLGIPAISYWITRILQTVPALIA